SPLSSNGVGGVQMAHVAVDKETGVVKIQKFVAVQDQGLVINPKTCKSQIYGAITMGISGALYEQRITDRVSGAFVNAELKDYKLPRLGDIGEIVIELYEPDIERARGVIGNGEPPVIAPQTAIANAVCNALGVRVPVVPMTPKRVLDALRQAAGRA
ncbi:MAG: molybdopterin cofactor-binding domain-containing protein, partial [Pirellulaceae bacterium]